MGADLTGAMIYGPRHIDTSKRGEVIRETAAEIEDVIINTYDGDLELNWLFGDIDRISPADIKAIVERTTDNFIAIWHGQAMPRDLFGRNITVGNIEQTVLFAGERTWGDPPEGHGYVTLLSAAILGIHNHFGCD